jgi:N-hydroxyarylamine O-acetyltransferase
MSINIPAYLKRINYGGPLIPSPETLRQLQNAHLLSVPFENLSIHYNQPIVLDDDALFDKIVNRRRGGFCYELNGLFAALLRGLGFKVSMLSARVANAAGEFGPDFDHMTLMVELEERWLADVGFGDSFRSPLLLDTQEEQVQNDRAYKLESDRDRLLLWHRLAGEDWKPQYSFNLQPFTYADYAGMCHYHQTSPESHFTCGRVCTRATPEGRVTLSELRLITSENGLRSEQLLSDADYLNVLKEQFEVDLAGLKRSAV